MSGLVIGVDGGGTRTRVLISDDSGAELTAFEGEGSAVRPNEVARSANIIASTVGQALEKIPDQLARIRALCVGVAGAGRQNDRDRLCDLLVERDIADEVFVETDAAIAMEDAFGEGAGILLIAGTGSVAFGRGPAGSLARCGGWGATCGDEGSGYWMGRRALSAITASADGREPETTLSGAILTALQLNDVEDLIAWAAAADNAQIASLAAQVLQCAAAGDLRSDALVTLASEELVLHLRTLARKLFVDERASFDVAVTGGLLESRSVLRKRLEKRIKSVIPGAELRQEEISPVRGATKRARRLLTVGAN